MLRDGEDRVFGELWRKSGPQARPNNFLVGSLPGYGGHVSAEIQWARKIDTLSSAGPLGLGSRRGAPADTALDLFQTRSSTPYSMRRLQMLQSPSQQEEGYVSSYDKKGNLTRRLQAEQKEMCSWYASGRDSEHEFEDRCTCCLRPVLSTQAHSTLKHTPYKLTLSSRVYLTLLKPDTNSPKRTQQ